MHRSVVWVTRPAVFSVGGRGARVAGDAVCRTLVASRVPRVLVWAAAASTLLPVHRRRRRPPTYKPVLAPAGTYEGPTSLWNLVGCVLVRLPALAGTVPFSSVCWLFLPTLPVVLLPLTFPGRRWHKQGGRGGLVARLARLILPVPLIPLTDLFSQG